jgi:hypothetical protein
VALSPICRSTSSRIGRKPRLKQEAGDETWDIRLHLAAFLKQFRPCNASGHARIVFGRRNRRSSEHRTALLDTTETFYTYLITSSARASSVDGTSRPRVGTGSRLTSIAAARSTMRWRSSVRLHLCPYSVKT